MRKKIILTVTDKAGFLPDKEICRLLDAIDKALAAARVPPAKIKAKDLIRLYATKGFLEGLLNM